MSLKPPVGRVGVLAFVALTLSACGGGGGGGVSSTQSASQGGTGSQSASGTSGSSGAQGSSGSQPAAAQTSATTITGVAGKGLLSAATVTFYAVGSDGRQAASLGSTTTDSKGNFSAQITASGPVIVDVTAGSGTQMQDEISGQFVTAPQGLELHAVFDSPGNLNGQPLAISPLTEMAYQTAISQSGGLTTANIDSANSAVGQVYLGGGPILSTLPIDITAYATASTAQQSLAQVLSALSVAASSGTATDVKGAACTGGYPADVPCLIGGLGSLISIGASGVPAATGAAGYVSSALSQIGAGTVQIAGQSPVTLGISTPTAATTTLVTGVTASAKIPGFQFDSDPVKNTKDVFANIRQNIIHADTSTAYGLNSTVSAIATDVATNVGPVANSIGSVIGDAYAATQLLQSGAAAGWRGNCTNDPQNTGSATATVVCEYASLGAYSNYTSSTSGNTTTWSWSSGTGVEVTVTPNADGTFTVATQPLQSVSVTTGTNGTPQQSQTNEVVGYSVPDPNYPAATAIFTVSADSTGAVSATFKGDYYVNASGGLLTANVTGKETGTATSDLTGDITLSGTLSNGRGGISLATATVGSDTDIHVVNGAGMAANPTRVPVATVEADCKAGQASFCGDIQFDWEWYDPASGADLGQYAQVPDATTGQYVDGYISPTTGAAVAGAPTATAVTGAAAYKAGINNVVWVDQPSVSSTTGGLVQKGTTMSVSGKVSLQVTTSQFAYAASVVLGTPVSDKSGTLGIPGEITASASVAQVGSSGSTSPIFTGVLNLTPDVSNYDATQAVSQSNHVGLQVSVVGSLTLSDSRTLDIAVTADGTLVDAVNATNNSGSFSASYSYQTPTGTFALNASGTYDPTNGAKGTVTSNTGVVVALAYPVGGSLAGTVTASGQTTSTATLSNTTISYSDGTTESLF